MEIQKQASEFIHQTQTECLLCSSFRVRQCAQRSRYREKSNVVPDFSLPRDGWREGQINPSLQHEVRTAMQVA